MLELQDRDEVDGVLVEDLKGVLKPVVSPFFPLELSGKEFETMAFVELLGMDLRVSMVVFLLLAFSSCRPVFVVGIRLDGI